MADITGIVLCGGKSLRMGQDKGLIEIMGKPMIEHVIAHIKPLCHRIMISTNNDDYKYLGYEVIHDEWNDSGPAAGILSCLYKSENFQNLVISCDLPMASTSFLERLYEYSHDSEITIPRVNTHMQPLCGYYDIVIRDRFKEYLTSGEKSMQFIVQYFNLRIISAEHLVGINLEKELMNFNTPEDLDRLKRTL